MAQHAKNETKNATQIAFTFLYHSNKKEDTHMNFISNLYFFWEWGVVMPLPCIVILGIGLDGIFNGKDVGSSIDISFKAYADIWPERRQQAAA